ncbi:MAG TPA: hypothetical protein VHL98_04900 [Microvirga sp.]|jgi:hypothetical protein|nr:hypothetical protein [Microvirga sp.]
MTIRRAAVLALALAGLAATEAAAFGLFTTERFDARIGRRNVPVTARLATEGLGYSVVQDIPDRRGRFLVHVTCREGGFRRTMCPTPAHEAYCPTARIACR